MRKSTLNRCGKAAHQSTRGYVDNMVEKCRKKFDADAENAVLFYRIPLGFEEQTGTFCVDTFSLVTCGQ